MNHFEKQLTQAVQKLSDGRYDGEIREVAEHFEDILQESIRNGKTEREAHRHAQSRIGILGDIARKIVDSPLRVNKAMRLQRTGVLLWILSPFISGTTSVAVKPFAPELQPYLFQISGASGSLMIAGGAAVAIGMFRARKINLGSLAFGIGFYLILTLGFYVWEYQTHTLQPTGNYFLNMGGFIFFPFIIGALIATSILQVAAYGADLFSLKRIKN